MTHIELDLEGGRIIEATFLETMPRALLQAQLVSPSGPLKNDEWVTVTMRDINTSDEYPMKVRLAAKKAEVEFGNGGTETLECEMR